MGESRCQMRVGKSIMDSLSISHPCYICLYVNLDLFEVDVEENRDSLNHLSLFGDSSSPV